MTALQETFGEYGGQYVPETLIPALEQLTAAWNDARDDPAYRAELDELGRTYVGRPSPITLVERFAPGRRVYLKRVVSLMRALAAQGSRVLWLGLPPMRDGRLQRRAKVLNRVFAEAADQVPRVEYLEVGMLLSGPDGDFATFGKQGDARRVRLRLDDGVHYSSAGARAIARWVVDWARERFPAGSGRRF